MSTNNIQNIEQFSRIKVIYNGLYFTFESQEELNLWETKIPKDELYIVLEDDVWVDLEDIIIETTIPYNDKPICPYCEVGPCLDDDICPICESKLKI